MAKTKSKQEKNKTIKNKAKSVKTSKTVKKTDKKEIKKSNIKAKIKKIKAVVVVASKKIASKNIKEAIKPALISVKNNAKAKVSVVEKNVVKAEKSESKPVVKTKPKSKKVEKKPEEEIEADLIGEDEFGDSEIAEYEEDLKAVEDEEEDTNVELSDDDDDHDKRDEEVYLTDSEGRRLCKVRDCDQIAAVEVYCRYHYLLLWKKIQVRKQILSDDKLTQYIENLTTRYTDKFIDVLKKDLKTEKDFLAVIQEMELDENALNENDAEGEDEVQSFSDEIRGIGEAPAMDDDGDF